jgi:hypothetical protein
MSPQGKWAQSAINSSVYNLVEFSNDHLYFKSENDGLTGFVYSKEFFGNHKDTSTQ